MAAMGMGMGMGVQQQVSGAAPTATPEIALASPGSYAITCATAGASIYYTLDGSTPDATKTLYSAPLSIIYPQTIKAIAIKDAVSSEIATLAVTASVYTIAAAAGGTKNMRIQTDANMTLTVSGGAEIKLESGGTWGTTVDISSGASNKDVYYRGNGTGGLLTFPSAVNVTYLYLAGTSTGIIGSINGMALTTLYLSGTSTAITGSISGMALTSLALSAIGTSITGTPAQIGTPLANFSIFGGTTYDYPWASQTFGGSAQTWTAATMAIDCVAAAPTPAQFNTWLLGLASVSNNGTDTLTFKNTPTLEEMTTAGLVGDGSGYYAMTTTKGYALVLGT